jgi:DNA primase
VTAVGLPTSPPGSPTVICEGESDVLAATTHGIPAVGVPGAANFKPAWLRLFRDRPVLLALDMDDAGERGTRQIACLFEQAGRPVPKRLRMGPGQDLAEFLLGASNDGGTGAR